MLFSKKKSAKVIHSISLRDNDRVLYNGSFQELPFSEELILSKSIHFYDDPAPCFIHRSAVRTRLLAEIEEELFSQFQDVNTPIPGSSLPLLTSYYRPDCQFTAMLTLS